MSPPQSIEAVASLRARLADAGFRPLAVFGPDARVNSPGKQPVGGDWQLRARRDPPAAAVEWPDRNALNTGLLADGLRAVDIDVDDREAAYRLRALAVEMLGDTVIRCRANTGRCLLPYRAAVGSPAKRTLAGRLGKIEVLGQGQQFVAFGTHHTGAALQWHPEPPGDVACDSLPAVTEQQVDGFLAAAAPIIGAERPSSPHINGHASPTSSTFGFSADPLDVTAALAAIPNDGAADWEWWNKLGMAVFAATGGSSTGYAAWCAWSERNPAHDPAVCQERWRHYVTSPPTSIGAGSLFHMAREARPGWTKPTDHTRQHRHVEEDGGDGQAAESVEDPRGDAAATEAGADTLLLDHRAPLGSARAFVSRLHSIGITRTLHHNAGLFHAWTGTHYPEIETAALKSCLYTFLETARQVRPDASPVPFNPNRAKVADVMDALAALTNLPAQHRPPTWLDGRAEPPASEVIACSNGLLHLPKFTLSPHSPLFFTANALPFAYDERAAVPAAWLAFLQSVWPNDPSAIDTLQEMFGLSLTGVTSHQKAFLIVGPKRSGKGTIARVLATLLGQDSVVGPTLSGIGQNFGLAPLIGKRLAIISDARLGSRADQQAIAERLLSITGEDALTVDRKFLPAWTGRLQTRFLILTNELPRLADASGAVASRFIVLVMARSFFGSEDHGLTDRITREMPGILNWAIAGWQRLAERGYFVQPASAADAVQEMEDLGSPVGAFLRERCFLAPSAAVRCSDLYVAWSDWCREHGRDHPGTTHTFGRDLSAAVPGLKVANPRAGDGSRERYYQGVGLDAR